MDAFRPFAVQHRFQPATRQFSVVRGRYQFASDGHVPIHGGPERPDAYRLAEHTESDNATAFRTDRFCGQHCCTQVRCGSPLDTASDYLQIEAIVLGFGRHVRHSKSSGAALDAEPRGPEPTFGKR